MTTKRVAAPTCIQPVRFRMNLRTGILASRHISPKMSAVSQIMEPTPLPRARPEWPLQAASTETTVSGTVVPREIMVAPMTILGRRVRRARDTAPSIILSALLDKSARHKAMMTNKSQVGVWLARLLRMASMSYMLRPNQFRLVKSMRRGAEFV